MQGGIGEHDVVAQSPGVELCPPFEDHGFAAFQRLLVDGVRANPSGVGVAGHLALTAGAGLQRKIVAADQLALLLTAGNGAIVGREPC